MKAELAVTALDCTFPLTFGATRPVEGVLQRGIGVEGSCNCSREDVGEDARAAANHGCTAPKRLPGEAETS